MKTLRDNFVYHTWAAMYAIVVGIIFYLDIKDHIHPENIYKVQIVCENVRKSKCEQVWVSVRDLK